MSRPWMPLYVADYRKDTGHLSTIENGAYLLLIMHYWATGGLPDNDIQLARITGMTGAEWRRAKPTIQAFFHDGWKHKRIDAELAHAADISNKRRAAVEQRERNRTSIDTSNDDHKTTQSQSPSHLQEKEVSNFRKVGEKKVNGWSPPRHGAQSQKHGTSYALNTSAEWPALAENYREHHGGRDPPVDKNGGFWFKTTGYGPQPIPKRLTG